MRPDIVLSTSDLHKSFRKGPEVIEVLKGIDLEVKRGEGVAVVGASGSGKSTLLHLLGGLEKPDRGIISYNGTDITGMDERSMATFRNTEIGFVFQFHYLLPDFTAIENVMMPALITSMPGAAAAKRARELLEIVGISHRSTHRPGELSGGEQQRLAIARALMMSPKVILADEPTGDLDPDTGAKITELFTRLKETLGITLVVATHNTDLAAAMDRVVVLKGGHLEEKSL